MQFVIQYGIDILLILILVSSVIVSIQKGFLKCVLSLLCAIAALAVAASYDEQASEWCYDNIVSDIVVTNIEKSINEDSEGKSAGTAIQTVIESVPDFISVSLAKLGVEVDDLTEEFSQLQLSSKDTAEKISDEIIRPGVLILLRLVLYLIIFFVVRFLLGLISGVICKIADLPILKQVNKTLGAAIGIVKGIIFVFALSIFFNFLADLLKNTNVFAQAIENSRICDIIKELI